MPYIERTLDGFDVLDLPNRNSCATISCQGAQVLSWKPGGSHRDILWCSPIMPSARGKAIRGGIPVCWPWFGPHATDPKRSQHGYARNLPWTLDHVGETPGGARARFSLSAASCAAFDPHAVFAVTLDIGLINTTLTLELTTTNQGVEYAPLSLALHTYFAVSDIGEITIEGLDGARYRDNTNSGAWSMQNGPMRIRRETIALFDDAGEHQTIIDPAYGRRIDVHRHGPGSTVVWNPGASAASMPDIPTGDERRFICLESGLIGSRALELAPGATHTLAVSIIATTL